MLCVAGKFDDLASSSKLAKFNSSPFMYTVVYGTAQVPEDNSIWGHALERLRLYIFIREDVRRYVAR